MRISNRSHWHTYVFSKLNWNKKEWESFLHSAFISISCFDESMTKSRASYVSCFLCNISTDIFLHHVNNKYIWNMKFETWIFWHSPLLVEEFSHFRFGLLRNQIIEEIKKTICSFHLVSTWFWQIKPFFNRGREKRFQIFSWMIFSNSFFSNQMTILHTSKSVCNKVE